MAAMKVNSGFMTVISIDGARYTVDGYCKRALLEELVPEHLLVAFNWTNHLETTPLVLSMSTFIYEGDNSIEVDIEDIDPYERRTFTNYLKLAEVINTWFKNHPNV